MTLFRGERRNYDPPVASLVEMIQRRSGTGTGLPVTEDQALTHSAVYACADLIADVVSTMPVDVLRRGPDGLPAHRPAPTVIQTPSADIDAINWRRVVVLSWLLRGNAFGLASGLVDASPERVELIHPDRASAQRARPDASPQWFLDSKPVERWPNGPLWVAAGKALHPGVPWGCSVLEHARGDIGVGLGARQFAAQFFNAGGIPTALLMNEKTVNEDGAKRVKDRFMAALGGGREPAVFGDGWKYEQISVAPNESQFLETIRANRADVAGYFRVPPEMIGAPGGDSMTYTNTEARGIDLLRFCVGQWVVRLETSLGTLVSDLDYVKLNVASLLRSDLEARFRAYGAGIRGGWMSVNDVRKLEDEPPIPGGDEYLWPPYRAFAIADDQSTPVAATAPGG